MGIFDFEGLSTDEINTLVALAQASYYPDVLPGVPGTPPAGWNTLVAEDLKFTGGLLSGTFQGDYFVAGLQALFSAAARVMQKDDTLVVSFQGTDQLIETLLYTEIGNTDVYIENFKALLEAVAQYAEDEGIGTIWITGHSLGAAAVNELNDIKDTAFDGAFSEAVFVSFATPELFEGADDVLNIGYTNDPVFKSVEQGGTFESATNNILYYNISYLSGQENSGSTAAEVLNLVEGLLFVHNIPNYIDGVGRITQSEFYDEMTRDSYVIVDDFFGTVKALEGTDFFGQATYFIGSDDNDRIVGGTANDSIEGFGGNDRLLGGDGDDVILGGEGRDLLRGQSGNDMLSGGDGNDRVVGGAGDDTLKGDAGIDRLIGGDGSDHYIVDFSQPFGVDTILFDVAEDSLEFENSGLTLQDLEAAYTAGFAAGTFDFGAQGTIVLVGFGVGLGFSVDDVILS
ncbi:MAG: hypothetical protein ROR55_05655 [Devosia sp.]